ncbi:hypothetical protein HGG70_07005 [Rhodobacteraceae bacterium R_SAG4]|nr:hypothetical protein [Rhodobacteraceae bacterium R_SAG4]
MTQFATTSEKNQFSFNCPIFAADVSMRSCLQVRDKVYKGEHLEVRRGCQACISSSKCPAAEIQRRISFKITSATDHCASDTPVLGKLPADILERIAPVLVREEHMRAYRVPSHEQNAIETSRSRIEAQIATAPRAQASPKHIFTSAAKPSKRGVAAKATIEQQPKITAVNEAAKSGDMAAALNAA